MDNLPSVVGFQMESIEEDIKIKIVDGEYLVIENMTRDGTLQSLAKSENSRSEIVESVNST